MKPTVPLPFPLVPDVMVTHVTLLAAVHAQLGPALTETVLEVVFAGTASVSGDTENVHVIGGPAEACVTVKVSLATFNVPVRAAPALEATSKLTVPVPVPLVPPVILIQLAVLVAVQGHPPGVVTLNSPVPPPAGRDWPRGSMVTLHEGGASV